MPRLSLLTCVIALLALPAHTSAESSRPNIVVVMTDDQPYYSVGEMPFVAAMPGLEPFGALYVNNAWCCPSRSTFLTGLYSHHTGIENNGADSFDDSSTLATWLDDAGYETGLFGKYLNGYPFGRTVDYVPPGWDRWVAFAGGPIDFADYYYDYKLSVDGSRRTFDHQPRDYSTDVLARKADAFVSSAPMPFFALITPYAPHRPRTPPPRYRHLYGDRDFPKRPNFNIAAADAPTFFQDLRPVRFMPQQSIWRRQMETLRAVDDLTKRVMESADKRGPTVLVFLSDNGYSLGSHRWRNKRCAYEECGRVPGLIRAPGDPTELLASNADLAPTLAELAGAARAPTDGYSLVGEMNGEDSQDPGREILLRNRHPGQGPGLPSFWGLRTLDWKYVDHSSAAGSPSEELYDLVEDPYELQNLATDPAYLTTLEDFRQRLAAARAAAPTN